jgi:hypothetical protein
MAKTLLENVRKNGCILYLTIYLQIYPYYPYIVEPRFSTIYFKKRTLKKFFFKRNTKKWQFQRVGAGQGPVPHWGRRGGGGKTSPLPVPFPCLNNHNKVQLKN